MSGVASIWSIDKESGGVSIGWGEAGVELI